MNERCDNCLNSSEPGVEVDDRGYCSEFCAEVQPDTGAEGWVDER